MRIKLFACACAMLPFALNVAAAADTVPDGLAPPAGSKRLMDLKADGVQIYRCGPPKDASGAPAAVWNFEAPRATLTDAQGKPAGRHYAGPTWEATDGSKITGKIAARAAAPDPQAIAWLMLKTESAGTAGRFDAVRAVQRVFTWGGSAPTGACSHVGEVLEVPYRAVYVFWVQ